MAGKLLFSLFFCLSTLAFSYDFQVIGIYDKETVLSGAQLSFSLIDGDSIYEKKDFEIELSPIYAGEWKNDTLKLNDNFIGKIQLKWNSPLGNLSQNFDVIKAITLSNKSYKLAIEDNIQLEFISPTVKDTSFISIQSNWKTQSWDKNKIPTYLLNLKGKDIDSVKISFKNQPAIKGYLMVNSEDEWIKKDSVQYDKTFFLIDSLKNGSFEFAFDFGTLNSPKTSLTVSPKVFSPYQINQSGLRGTTLRFESPLESENLEIKIKIYNMDGQMVRLLTHEKFEFLEAIHLEWQFDGLDQNQNILRNGRYRVVFQYKSNSKFKTIIQDVVVFR